jgi:hypothetical protein
MMWQNILPHHKIFCAWHNIPPQHLIVGNNTNHTMERIEPECQENKQMIRYTLQTSGHRLILLLS